MSGATHILCCCDPPPPERCPACAECTNYRVTMTASGTHPITGDFIELDVIADYDDCFFDNGNNQTVWRSTSTEFIRARWRRNGGAWVDSDQLFGDLVCRGLGDIWRVGFALVNPPGPIFAGATFESTGPPVGICPDTVDWALTEARFLHNTVLFPLDNISGTITVQSIP